MKIPDTVLAFQILGGGLNKNQQQTALTLASDLIFKSMKRALKGVSGSENVEKDCNCDNYDYLDLQIKEENVCYTQQPFKQKKGKFHSLTKQGVVFRCAICDSKMHWAKDCQHKRSETANIAELNKIKTEDNSENIMKEASIVLKTTADTEIHTDLNAITDTACTKTVAGEEWLNNYLKTLDDTLIN